MTLQVSAEILLVVARRSSALPFSSVAFTVEP